MPDVTIYTKSWCPYCQRAKALLKKKGVPFHEIDIEKEPAERAVMIGRAHGRTTVPQIFIDDRHIGGSDDLHALDAEGTLDKLLSDPQAVTPLP
ncbi:glutaredoxin 3 [Pseudochelatococcus lubricantis]|uniref:Glutaredoxin n=1 Tax=Pseudochelatococcus lubricantis TaxID=1538102 RepID=A0ABX0UWM4_9HYPH|nr:glutaredoxin 3 [Pseudochelatococcus lubricantis]NIJ57333.1 glutaredoxin 3 [Pseudochelatococcus lubricantis]